MSIIRLSLQDTPLQRDVSAFWLRTWIAGEIGLAPHCYGTSISYDFFSSRVQHQLSKAPKYAEFFASFSPVDNEFCVKESCPDNTTVGTACPFPNGFTFLSTNRRVFYVTDLGIAELNLCDVINCELQVEKKIATGISITKSNGETVRIGFRMPLSFAENFASRITNRARIARENSDVPALKAALDEYWSTGGLRQNKKPTSGVAIFIGVAAGIFFFFTSLSRVDSFGTAIILGVFTCCVGYWFAKTIGPMVGGRRPPT